MMKKINLHLSLIICFTFLFQIQEALAGPGGKILKELFDTPLGKILGIVLGIIFLPFIIYSAAREAIEVKRTHNDLKKLSVRNARIFGWFEIKNRVQEVFGQVHNAWGKEDMSQASQWMTPWYWQNQQLMYLDRWEAMGRVNVCNVRKVLNIKPLHLHCSNEDNFEHSRIVVSIEANMEDYLMERETGKVVEGRKGYKNGVTVWTFVLNDGKWKVENIEEDSQTMSYAKLKNVLPGFLNRQSPTSTVQRPTT